MSTIRVQRANVILDIRPDEKERYMDMGYSVIDKVTGNVVEEAISNDVNVLRTQVTELKSLVAEKDKEIEKLKASLSKKTKAEKASDK
jgi:uncharacterized small protein (DUF1192 family)